MSYYFWLWRWTVQFFSIWWEILWQYYNSFSMITYSFNWIFLVFSSDDISKLKRISLRPNISRSFFAYSPRKIRQLFSKVRHSRLLKQHQNLSKVASSRPRSSSPQAVTVECARSVAIPFSNPSQSDFQWHGLKHISEPEHRVCSNYTQRALWQRSWMRFANRWHSFWGHSVAALCPQSNTWKNAAWEKIFSCQTRGEFFFILKSATLVTFFSHICSRQTSRL